MIGNIISQIIAHKAGIAIGGAIIGVAVTAVLASKDGMNHDQTKKKAEFVKDHSLSDEEIVEMMENQGFSEEEVNDFKKNDEIPDNFQYLDWKERAIIFFKSYWKTLLAASVTIGLMVFSHISMAKEMAAVTAALGLISTKYKDLDEYLRKNYPDQYNEIKRILNRKNARKAISENYSKKEETYDGRKRYYLPLSDQITFMKESDWTKVQHFIDAKMGTEMECYLNEVLDYIHYELGYKDVHISDVDYVWSFGDDVVEPEDFPQICFDYDDVLDDNTMVVCQVVQPSITPELVVPEDREFGIKKRA